MPCLNFLVTGSVTAEVSMSNNVTTAISIFGSVVSVDSDLNPSCEENIISTKPCHTSSLPVNYN